MSQKNETPILVLSLLITVGLIAGGLWWFTKKSGFDLGKTTDSQSKILLIIAKRGKVLQNN